MFKAVLKWVDCECARQGINIEEDKTARRRVLGDSVYEIRFLAMSLEDFTKYVSSTGILTEAEVISIYQKFGGLDVADLKWKKSRKRQRPRIVGSNRSDVANKAVLFHGVRLFGDAKGSQYEVTFKVKDKNVTGTYTSERDKDGVCGYDVMLPKPVSLQPDEEFTIIATIKGPIFQDKLSVR